MPQEDEHSVSGTNPLSAIRQYPLVMAAFIVLFAVVGAALASAWPSVFEATAGIVVEDSRGSELFDNTRPADPERYVADQVAILESRLVAERASEIVSIVDPDQSITTGEFLASSSFSFNQDTDFVTIRFRAGNPAAAMAGANAIGLAYQEVVERILASDAETAIGRLDDAIDSVVADIASLQHEIESMRTDNEERSKLDEQLGSIIAELVALRETPPQVTPVGDGNATITTTDAITAKANQLAAELQARELISAVESRLPATAFLTRQQEDALDLLGELNLRQSQLEVDAQLAGNGVALFSPAGNGKPKGVSVRTAVILSVTLGALVGGGIAYAMTQQRRRLENRLQPQLILGVPLLAEIPVKSGGWVRQYVRSFFSDVFSDKSTQRQASHPDLLPVITSPASAAAESYRVLVSAVQHQLKERTAPIEGDGGVVATRRPGVIVAIVSSSSDEGKTMVATNTAIAASRSGSRVLLVDGDFGAQGASLLFNELDDSVLRTGLTEVVRDHSSLDSAIKSADVGDGFVVDLLGRGDAMMTAPDLFGSQAVATVFQNLTTRYDLIILDVPPILGMAYASAAVQHADFALVLAKHGGSIANLEELRYRLQLIGVPALGYVYTNAPVRRQV